MVSRAASARSIEARVISENLHITGDYEHATEGSTRRIRLGIPKGLIKRIPKIVLKGLSKEPDILSYLFINAQSS